MRQRQERQRFRHPQFQVGYGLNSRGRAIGAGLVRITNSSIAAGRSAHEAANKNRKRSLSAAFSEPYISSA